MEEDTEPSLFSNGIFIKQEAPEDDFKPEEDEEDIEYASGNVLFGNAFDDIVVKEEVDAEEPNTSSPNLDDPTFASIFVKQENQDEESTTIEDRTSNALDVFEFEDETMENVPHNKNAAPQTRPSEGKSQEKSPEPANKLYTCTYTCTICSNTFSDRSKLQEHLNQHTKESYACNSCAAVFNSKDELCDHVTQHQCRWTCPNCPSVFSRVQTFQNHIKSHGKTHAEIASLLPKSALNGNNALVLAMKRNFSNVDLKKPFTCRVCKMKFKSESGMNGHLRNKHPNTPVFMHKCKLCPAKFQSNTELSQHIIIRHHDKKNLKCKLCGETFRLISHLKTHLKMCSKEKPFSCIRCSAQFRRPKEMRVHFKQMHPDTVYTCGHCYEDFHKKRLLREHMQKHPGAYPCTKCPLIYNLESSLKKHLDAHLEEEYLEEAGIDSAGRMIELRKHYLDLKAVMLSCGHCAAKFKDRADLTLHLKMHYMPTLPGDEAHLKNPFRSPYAKNLQFSLAQELKKNFAQLKFRINKS